MEPDVDPYFAEGLKSQDQARIEKVIIEYLELYIDPEIISKIRFVDKNFFLFEGDDEDDDRKTWLKSHEGLPAGTIIIYPDFERYNDAKVIFHSILVFCMLAGYLINNPDDKRLKRLGSWEGGFNDPRGGFSTVLKCLNDSLFRKDYSARITLLYVAPDLSALYSNDNRPQKVKVLARDDNKILIKSKEYTRNSSFVVRHTYQEDLFDDMLPEVVESIILPKMDIEEIIALYDTHQAQWLSDNAFASTLAWTDDGFIYALLEKNTDLVEAFVSRNPKRIREMINSIDLKPESEYVSNRRNLNTPYDEFVRFVIFKAKNKKIDQMIIDKDTFTVLDLYLLASAGRSDLLLALPISKIKIDISDWDFSHQADVPYTRKFFEELGERSERIADSDKIIVKYWKVFKEADSSATAEEPGIINNDVIWDLVLDDLIFNDGANYKALKQVDPVMLQNWVATIKPENYYIFSSDELYNDLIRAKPITDEEIQKILEYMAATSQTKNKRGNRITDYKIYKMNPKLKARFKRINRDKKIGASLNEY